MLVWAYIGKRKIITFAFHFFHFKTSSGKVTLLSLSLLKSDFFTFFTFTFAFEKRKNHFSRKSLKVKKVKSESDYFSRSNV